MSFNESNYLRLNISLEESSLEQAINRRLEEIAKSKKTRLKGFMPGKIPISAIRDQYYKAIRQEVLQACISKECEDLLIARKQDLSTACIHTVIPGQEPVQGQLEFIVIVYTFGNINFDQLKNLDVERPIVEISEEDVETKILQLRMREASWQKVYRPIENWDRVTIIVLNTNIYTVPCGQALTLLIGSGNFMYDLENALLGHKPNSNDFIKINTDAGWFLLSIVLVEEGIILDDEKDFLNKLGFQREDELKQSIKEHMQDQIDILTFHAMKDHIIRKVVINDELALDVPSNVLERSYIKDRESNKIHKNPIQVYNLKEAWLFYLLEQETARMQKENAALKDLTKKDVNLILSLGFPEDRCSVLFNKNLSEKEVIKYIDTYRSIEHLLKHVTIVDKDQNYREFMKKHQVSSFTSYRI